MLVLANNQIKWPQHQKSLVRIDILRFMRFLPPNPLPLLRRLVHWRKYSQATATIRFMAAGLEDESAVSHADGTTVSALSCRRRARSRQGQQGHPHQGSHQLEEREDVVNKLLVLRCIRPSSCCTKISAGEPEWLHRVGPSR